MLPMLNFAIRVSTNKNYDSNLNSSLTSYFAPLIISS